MLDIFLVSEKTTVTSNGVGLAQDISPAQGSVVLLTLTITEILEQESLDVTVWGSSDGAAWSQKPLARFPQKFYRGEHPMLLDLGQHPEVKFLRVQWELARWGRGEATAAFEFQLRAKEVSAEILQETANALQAR